MIYDIDDVGVAGLSSEQARQGLSVLLIESDARAARELQARIGRAGLQEATVEVVSSPADGLGRLSEERFQAVLLASGGERVEASWIGRVARRAGRVPVVVLLEIDDREAGLAAIRAGAQDVVVRSEVSDGGLGRVITFAIERRRIFDELSHLAFHDYLTGVPNRLALRKRLDRSLRRYRDGGDDAFSVLLVDLNGFKRLNDNHGHAAGDDVLVQVARGLEESIRPRDLVARIGGDEFAIIVEGSIDAEELRAIAERIQGRLGLLTLVDGSPARMSASVGIVNHRGYPNAEEMLHAADNAMYEAKRKRVAYSFADSPSAGA